MPTNHGKCSNVRPAITEAICEDMRGRKALVCNGCPGPTLALSGEIQGSAAIGVLNTNSDAEGTSGSTTRMTQLISMEVEEVYGTVPAEPLLPIATSYTPGFFVDCTGHEDLLQAYRAAVEARGLDLSGIVLDLMYLFNEGQLVLLEEGEE